MKHFIGIDLGGTNIKCAVVNENFEIIEKGECKTALPRDWKLVLDDCVKIAFETIEKASLSINDFAFLGIGSPGIINEKDGIVERAVNLGFENVPIKEYMQSKIPVPVIVENDANAAAYGEFIAGVCKDTNYKNMISLTIGTGIGSGIIIKGKIFRGSNGLGGEIGHTVIHAGGRPCSCGMKGCMDRYISASGIKLTTKEAMQSNKDSIMWKDVNNDIDSVSGRTAFRCAEKGDTVAQNVLDSYISDLAYSIANIINIFQPEVIVISGGISKEGETLLTPLRAQVAKFALQGVKPTLPIICVGNLQNTAGILGAALLGV